ncbi:uncharacterized protein LOC132054669 [Lycium ferocissimum]|uniref:uncharacterized protein LOC132054669 n=1 Tax=Lycium ferocissimum TaxID=112874 RepID=UPI002814EA33|nr:uncharacterized protein LOC132054669 [Lycium ferocissimum]
MAPFTNKQYPYLIIMVVLCIFLFPMMQAQSYDSVYYICGSAHGKATMQYLIQNRKLLLKEKETVTIIVPGTGSNEGHGHAKIVSSWNGKNKSGEYVELREAPMGPDPLHHHGGSPRNKPALP